MSVWQVKKLHYAPPHVKAIKRQMFSHFFQSSWDIKVQIPLLSNQKDGKLCQIIFVVCHLQWDVLQRIVNTC